MVRLKIGDREKDALIYLPITYPQGILRIEYDGGFNYKQPVPVPNDDFKCTFEWCSRRKNPNNKGNVMKFRVKRNLEAMIEASDNSGEWLKNKAKEITEGCLTQREKIDRLVTYVAKEVPYMPVQKEIMDNFIFFLEKNQWDDVKEVIEAYLPVLKNSMLFELLKYEENVEKEGEEINNFDEKLDKIETEFDTRMNSILAVYEPLPGIEENAKSFLITASKAWHLFGSLIADTNFNPEHIIREGGKCIHKSKTFNALCNALGITSVYIRAYRDGMENAQHALNGVKLEDGWELDDPTQDKKQIKESRYVAKCILSKKPGQKIISAEFEPLEQEKVNK